MDFRNIAQLVNAETIPEASTVQEVEILKLTVDNSESISNIEKAKQLLVGEKEARENRADINGTGSGSRSASSSQGSKGEYRSGYSPYDGNRIYRSESDKEKARKYADGCFKASKDRALKSRRPDWDIVSAINRSAADRRKTESELRWEARKRGMKKGFLQMLVAAGEAIIESLYLEKRREK